MADEYPVYVVDDDALLRRALARLITSFGHTVHTYASATEFLSEVDEMGAGCAVVDLRLPDIDGVELHRQLRRNGIYLPVIYLTGYADIPTTVSAIKAGAVDFLQKPVSEEALLEAISAGMAESRKRLEERARQNDLAQRYATLTPREREVIQLVLEGRLNKQIARQLRISEKTVKVHRAHAMSKLGTRKVAVLAQEAAQLGLVARPEEKPL